MVRKAKKLHLFIINSRRDKNNKSRIRYINKNNNRSNFGIKRRSKNISHLEKNSNSGKHSKLCSFLN